MKWPTSMVAAVAVLALVDVVALNVLRPGTGGPLVAAAIWIACLVLLSRQNPRGLLSFECLFLLLLGLFHLGKLVPLALGAETETHPEWLSSSYVGAAVGLFSAAAAAFTLGAQFARPSPEDPPEGVPRQPSLFWIGFMVATVATIMILVGAAQLHIFTTTYDEYYEQALTQDVRLFGFGTLLFPIGLLVAAVGASRRQMLLLAAMLALALGPLFISGFRGHALVAGVALVAVWARKEYRLAKLVAGVGIIAMLLLVPAIRMARGGERRLSETFSDVRPLAFVSEAGGSMAALVMTYDLLHTLGEPFWMGKSYRMAAARVVPNVALVRTSRLDKVWEDPPAFWITRHLDPWLYDHGGGYGFSGIAEPYLNFGWAGVIVWFILLGFLLRLASAWFLTGPFRGAAVAASFGSILWTVRNDAMDVFRTCTYACLIVLVAWIVDRQVRGPELRT